MNQNGRKVVIIGGGIAGLCTAVYALQCGYRVEVIEMSDMAGGLAMSWRRGRYTFETCLHWLVGSSPNGEMNQQWREVCDFDKLTFVDPEIFVRLEDQDGGALTIYTDVDRLEEELLRRAPQDVSPIKGLTQAIRSMGKFRMLDPTGGLAENGLKLLRDVPMFPLLGRLSKISGRDYAKRFSDPLLRTFFGEGAMGQLPAVALVLTLAWMNTRNAGYCYGGSQALIRLIEDRIAALGGRMRFGSKVERIVVENDVAKGVQLAGGEVVSGDWVVSAADGHETIFDLLEARYADEATKKIYAEKELFASYLQVSLGVAMDLRKEAPMVTRMLAAPLTVDPGTEARTVAFRFFHFDPTFAPAGKTAVTSLLLTRNFEYWTKLREKDPEGYRAEKQRVAEAVIAVLEERIPGVRDLIEVVDVSTPATVIRYTGNWKGSMEGWLPVPGSGFRPYPNHLRGLKNFLMVGQWVMPGGGLPSGPMTGRPAVKAMCKRDRVAFTPGARVEELSGAGV